MSDCCECTYYNKQKMDGPASGQPIQCQCCDGGSEFIERGKRPKRPTRAQVESLHRAALEDIALLRANYAALHSDYAAMKAERDVLARCFVHAHAELLPKYATYWDGGECNLPVDNRGIKCVLCKTRGAHRPGCPVELAEKIVKEAGDGR